MGENKLGLDEDLVNEMSAVLGDLDVAEPPKKPKKSDLESSAFPSEMRCNQVFDQLLKCYSLGGQIRHYYRYGEISYCHETRDKLKTCLKAKLRPEIEGRQVIQDYYKRQLAEKRAAQCSSEAVWDAREEPLRRPFREDVERPEGWSVE